MLKFILLRLVGPAIIAVSITIGIIASLLLLVEVAALLGVI